MATIYQLYYTRRGRQGIDAGWGIVANSEGIPETVKNIFKGQAANLLNANPRTEGVSLAFDLQMNDNFVFLSHINYYSINENGETDARGNSFIHGFVMRKAEYQELVREPEPFLGIQEDWIVLNYNGEEKLPVLQTIPGTEPAPEPLLDKYHLDQDSFFNLMKCVYWAMEKAGRSLTIVSEPSQAKELKNVSQEIGFLILRCMPYSLRVKVSVFSGVRPGAVLCFSDNVPETGVWFSLETGGYSCPQMPEYEFIKYFSNVRLKSNLQKMQLEQLDEFINITYDRDFEDLELRHVELAYHAEICKNLEKLSEEDLDKYMREALLFSNINYEMIDKYYARLIQEYLQKDLTFSSQKILNKLQKRYEATSCQFLKNVFVSYYIKHECFVGATQAYEMLYDLETNRAEDFQDFFIEIGKHCLEFYNDYSLNYKLERTIASFDDLLDVWEQKQKFPSSAEGEKLLEIMEKLFEGEMETSENNSHRYEICRKYVEFCNHLPSVYEDRRDSFIWNFCDRYWKDFQIEEFTYKDTEEYRKLEELQKENSSVCGLVKQLLEMREFLLQEIGRKDSQRAPMLPEIERKDLQRELLLQEDNVANFQYVFFTNSVIKDENLRKRLLQELHEEVYNNGKLSLDTSLLLNFPSEEGVDLKKLVKDLDSINWIASNSDKWLALSNAIESSKVLKNEGNEHIFKCMLKEAVKTERSDILQKLYQYYFPKKSGSELDLYLVDIVRKWQLFLAISMTQILLAKYVMGMNPVLGKVIGVIGFAFTVIGLLASMYFGVTNSFLIIFEGNGEVIRWMIIFVILSVISLASAIILSGVWINMIQGAVIVLLLTGRLCYGSIKIT